MTITFYFNKNTSLDMTTSHQQDQNPCKKCEDESQRHVEQMIPCYRLFTRCLFVSPPYNLFYVDKIKFYTCFISSILLPFLVVFVILWATSLQDLDRIQVPCVNEIVWVSIDEKCGPGRTGPCLHSYRRLQWRYPLPDGPAYSYNLNIAECEWKSVSQPGCDYNYTLAWARDHWLNVTDLCLIHSKSGKPWTTLWTPKNSTRWVPNAIFGMLALCFCSIICACMSSGITMSVRTDKLKDSIGSIPDQHEFHTSDLVPFLIGAQHQRLRNPNTPFDVFVNDPIYDGSHLPKLIGQFVGVNKKCKDLENV